jgi:hypothetical protein
MGNELIFPDISFENIEYKASRNDLAEYARKY